MELIEFHNKMKEIYRATEDQFLEFSEIVPFETNDWSVNSPRLYFLLLTICGQVESLMKKICDEVNIEPKIHGFPHYYKIINKDKILGIQKIVLIKTNQSLNTFNENDPEHFWWISHNKAKHELPEGILYGTIKNVIYALGGLFTLHEILSKIPFEDKQRILVLKYWETHKPITVAESRLEPEKYYNQSFSKLFISHTHYYGGPGL
ncbi:MAG: conserved hypothetical protein [Marine Group I thaumarchaeote]|nr:MAG: conserved hypothetical protein [Marine Group I thaumarchaeote]